MKIIVALDSSVYAERILSELTSRSWPDGTELRLITAVESTGHWDTDQQLVHQAECILMSRIKSLKQHLPITISCVGEVVDGNAASPILSTARDWCAELIMIGSYGDTGARRSGIGSVAAAIVNEAPCSVEVIKLKNERNERSKTAKMAYAAVTHDLKP